MASKLAALEALPGFTQQQAQAAVAAIPSLLNLKPDKLKNRWQLLQEVRPATRFACTGLLLLAAD